MEINCGQCESMDLRIFSCSRLPRFFLCHAVNFNLVGWCFSPNSRLETQKTYGNHCLWGRTIDNAMKMEIGWKVNVRQTGRSNAMCWYYIATTSVSMFSFRQQAGHRGGNETEKCRKRYFSRSRFSFYFYSVFAFMIRKEYRPFLVQALICPSIWPWSKISSHLHVWYNIVYRIMEVLISHFVSSRVLCLKYNQSWIELISFHGKCSP